MKNLGRKLGVAIGLVSLVGCAEIQQGARSPFAQNLTANALSSMVGEVIHQEVQSQYPENIPQTDISVNNYQGGQTPTQTYTEEQYRQLQQQKQTQLEAAREGRSNIQQNVYVQGQQGQKNQSQRENKTTIGYSLNDRIKTAQQSGLCISRWIDSNKNDIQESTDDFQETERFLEEDNILFIGRLYRGQYGNLLIKDTESGHTIRLHEENFNGEGKSNGKMFLVSYNGDNIRRCYENPYTLSGKRKYLVELTDKNTNQLIKSEEIIICFKDKR
ncbi:MAG: hypothetical protein Q7S56_03670 [Nanoarchaeota archaeon]|nr:hypothetical protein [Nanoarchaeota archaeon]